MRLSASIGMSFVSCLLATGCQTTPRNVYTSLAPKPIGPYSQAVIAGSLIFGSGQLGIDPATGRIDSTTASGQTEQALKNVFAVLKESGSDPTKIVRMTIYFSDLKDFQTVNAIYEKMLGSTKPARVAVEVSRMPLGALIELDYIATH